MSLTQVPQQGKYSIVLAPTTCSRCPPNAHSAAASTQCLCNAGYFGMSLSLCLCLCVSQTTHIIHARTHTCTHARAQARTQAYTNTSHTHQRAHEYNTNHRTHILSHPQTLSLSLALSLSRHTLANTQDTGRSAQHVQWVRTRTQWAPVRVRHARPTPTPPTWEPAQRLLASSVRKTPTRQRVAMRARPADAKSAPPAKTARLVRSVFPGNSPTSLALLPVAAAQAVPSRLQAEQAAASSAARASTWQSKEAPMPQIAFRALWASTRRQWVPRSRARARNVPQESTLRRRKALRARLAHRASFHPCRAPRQNLHASTADQRSIATQLRQPCALAVLQGSFQLLRATRQSQTVQSAQRESIAQNPQGRAASNAQSANTMPSSEPTLLLTVYCAQVLIINSG